MTPETLAQLLGAVGRGGAYLAALLIIGAAAFAHRVADRAAQAEVIRSTSTLAARAALTLAAAHVWRLYAETYLVFGIEDPVTLDYVRIVAVDTTWGSGWIAQVVVAGGAFAVLYGVRRETWARWTRLGVAVAVAMSLGFTGHTVSQGAVPVANQFLQGLHVLAAGAWLGTLAVILGRRRLVPPDAFARWVTRFSPMAILAVSVLVLSGATTAIIYLKPLSGLWTTPYGWTLLGKVALVFTIGVAGAYNWRVVTPRLRRGAGPEALTRTAGLELAGGTLVLLVTAVLSGLPLE